MPSSSAPLIVSQTLDKDFVCRQILEISDIARVQGNVAIALEGMAIIAAIQGMLNDPGE